jgi:glycosyltransferase involved in cell wall biosynthesis
MRVGLITTGFPRFEGDCSGAFLLTLARGLVRSGHSVRVLAPEPRRRRETPCWPGIDLSWVPYARPRSLQRTFYGSGAPDNLRLQPGRWAGAASFVAALHCASARELSDCDALVSSWCLPSGWVASKTAAGRSHLCICHETDVRWLCEMPAGSALARDILAGASSLWFLSTDLRDRFFARAGLDPSGTTCHVGSMPIEAPLHPCETRDRIRQHLDIQGFTLIFLGRLVPVKGLDRLLRALAELQEPVGIRVAGDGPERPRLQALARRLGIDARFEGWVSGERKEALLSACDAIVVPSEPEDGLPTVLFEAKARGLPIISTALGAIPEPLRSHPDTLLVPPLDRGALARAIQQLRARHEAG